MWRISCLKVIYFFIFDIYFFLIYNHSKQDGMHLEKQQVSLYQVIPSNTTLVYIFRIYNHSKQENGHLRKQQVYLYQVEYSKLIWCLYLPNLQSFQTGEKSFKYTSSLSLSSNSTNSLYHFRPSQSTIIPNRISIILLYRKFIFI